MSDGGLKDDLHRKQLDLWGRLHLGHAARLSTLESSIYPGYRFPWRIAEGPALVPRELFARDVATMRELIQGYAQATFRESYRERTPERWRRPDDRGWFPKFVATDFQRIYDHGQGKFRYAVPEIQSFPANVLLKPTLLQSLLGEVPGMSERHLLPTEQFEDFEAYLLFLKRLLLGEAAPADTIILELAPLEQKTVVDMLLYVKHFGVRLVDLRDAVTDTKTGAVLYAKAVVWKGDRPVLETFSSEQRAWRILSRCLPSEVDDEVGRSNSTLDPVRVRAIFQASLEKEAVEFLVHPQDFFVLSKETLVGHPQHWPPLLSLTRRQVDAWKRDGFEVGTGILKPTDRAGGQGLRGLDIPLTMGELERLLDRGDEGRWLWQEKYGADEFSRSRIVDFQGKSEGDSSAIYHELRLMWAMESHAETCELSPTLLTGMTRWSRVGEPANAGRQKTAFTGTHGLLVM